MLLIQSDEFLETMLLVIVGPTDHFFLVSTKFRTQKHPGRFQDLRVQPGAAEHIADWLYAVTTGQSQNRWGMVGSWYIMVHGPRDLGDSEKGQLLVKYHLFI